MWQISVGVNHINTSTLGFSIIFKNAKGSWDQKVWELLQKSILLEAGLVSYCCLHLFCSNHTKTFHFPEYVMLSPPSSHRQRVNLWLFLALPDPTEKRDWGWMRMRQGNVGVHTQGPGREFLLACCMLLCCSSLNVTFKHLSWKPI